MLDTGGQPTSSRIETTQEVFTFLVGGRRLGVDLDLVRELIPNPETHEIDVVLRTDDGVVTLGVQEVGRPVGLDVVEAAGIEMATRAQLHGF